MKILLVLIFLGCLIAIDKDKKGVAKKTFLSIFSKTPVWVRYAVGVVLVVMFVYVFKLVQSSSHDEAPTQTTPSYVTTASYTPPPPQPVPTVSIPEGLRISYGEQVFEQGKWYRFSFADTVYFEPTRLDERIEIEIQGTKAHWKQWAVRKSATRVDGEYYDFIGKADVGEYAVRLLTPSTIIDFTNKSSNK